MKAELLAPAGGFAKLKTALHFGADAAYVGGKQFSLRTFADNFTMDELKSAVDLTHKMGKKLYVTANIFARNADFALLEDYFKALESLGADAAIISDPNKYQVSLILTKTIKTPYVDEVAAMPNVNLVRFETTDELLRAIDAV
ncbi:MAG: hypothetical protein IIX02_07310, partial [Clostridia bacterium]|nr:hypothetical protein [Clostridia bacterium]